MMQVFLQYKSFCIFNFITNSYRNGLVRLKQQFYNNNMKKINNINHHRQVQDQILQRILYSSNQKLTPYENFQHNQYPVSSLKSHPSKEFIDTECTSNPPDYFDKHSLKFIEQTTEFQAEDQPPNCHSMINLRQQGFSGQLFEGAKKRWSRTESTLQAHFQKTMKIDKYLRLVCSIIKTWRAYTPKSRLTNVYKELILARRVIRWESKYDTVINFVQKQEVIGMKLFKIMQLTGDFVDLTAFWIKILNKGTEKHASLIDRLEQTESNFYFTECCIWFAVYAYRYISLRSQKTTSEKELGEAKKKVMENLLKAIKYSMDILTSYNNSTLKRLGGEINHKLAGYLTFFSSAIGVFLLWS